MPQPAANSRVVRFGAFELDLESRELRKSGIRVKLQEQPFLILEMLLDRRGAIVTREELKQKLWPADTFVDFDLSLNSAVKKLRQALNDDSDNPRYVETLYRRGYRFIGTVNGSSGNGAPHVEDSRPLTTAAVPLPPTPPQTAVISTSRKRLALYGATVGALVLLGAALILIPSGPPRVLGYTQ